MPTAILCHQSRDEGNDRAKARNNHSDDGSPFQCEFPRPTTISSLSNNMDSISSDSNVTTTDSSTVVIVWTIAAVAVSFMLLLMHFDNVTATSDAPNRAILSGDNSSKGESATSNQAPLTPYRDIGNSLPSSKSAPATNDEAPVLFCIPVSTQSESAEARPGLSEKTTPTTNITSNNNNWRCACEGGFLPPGMLKSFGGAEAMLRFGAGQCYQHK